MKRDEHPIANVVWTDPADLRANDYNPNQVYPPELDLLKTSLRLSGWTQPIVARPDGEIVDGFHRWSIHNPESPLYDEALATRTGGLVPVVRLPADTPRSEQMMATVRHNRARGEHAVLKMAGIVRSLHDEQGLSFEEIGERLGMEEEEIDRLYDSGGMTQRGRAEAFSAGWVPE